jgi:CRP/FNR family transcriptional regulator, cyclic AMP receptor protein
MRTVEGDGACYQRLPALSFLSALSPQAAEAFDEIKVTTTYPAGSVLFVESETPRGVFVLASGRVKLSMGSASGKVMILRIAKAGEILGLHAVVSSAVFQATAQTVELCKVSFVRGDEFLRFLRDYPAASLEAARQLSFSYQEACDQLRAIGLCDSARQKVARFVLEWAANGEKLNDGVRATLTLTHEEIGQLIGTSRETITRAFTDFRARRWILTKGSTLVVQNRSALQHLVGRDAYSSGSSERPDEAPASAARPYMNPRSPALVSESHPW